MKLDSWQPGPATRPFAEARLAGSDQAQGQVEAGEGGSADSCAGKAAGLVPDLTALAEKLCIQEWLDGLDEETLAAIYRGSLAGSAR